MTVCFRHANVNPEQLTPSTFRVPVGVGLKTAAWRSGGSAANMGTTCSDSRSEPGAAASLATSCSSFATLHRSQYTS